MQNFSISPKEVVASLCRNRRLIKALVKGEAIGRYTGLELGGSVSAPNADQSIPYLTAGTPFSVEFRFTCNLNPGSYFLNAGATRINREGEAYLHRVLDISMFKVMPVSDNTSTLIIDFNCAAEIDILSNPLQKLAAE